MGIGPLSWVPGETHLIVAALVATVTFEAGFTFPGGYNENDGKAILAKKAAFKAFVVMDTLAMVFSVSATFVYFYMAIHEKSGVSPRTLYLGRFSHHVWHGVNGGGIHDWHVRCATTFLWLPIVV